jgi:hypothetical protein
LHFVVVLAGMQRVEAGVLVRWKGTRNFTAVTTRAETRLMEWRQ